MPCAQVLARHALLDVHLSKPEARCSLVGTRLISWLRQVDALKS